MGAKPRRLCRESCRLLMTKAEANELKAARKKARKDATPGIVHQHERIWVRLPKGKISRLARWSEVENRFCRAVSLCETAKWALADVKRLNMLKEWIDDTYSIIAEDPNTTEAARREARKMLGH